VAIHELAVGLRELWRALEEAAGERPLSRALALNLIAVAERECEAELQAALERVLLRHPCRAFVLLLDASGATPAMAATLGAHVRDSGIGRVVLQEQITLRLTPADLHKAPGVVRPLLASDVPSHLFWSAPLPRADAELLALARLADRVVVDGCRLADPLRDCARLRALPVRVVDLTWFRLAPWRRALAEAFEHFSWNEAGGTRVRILHGPDPGALCASHQLGEWLHERLRAEVVIAPHPRAPAVATFEPADLELRHRGATVSIVHLPAQQRLRVAVTLDDVCLLPFLTPVSRGSPGDLLAAAIDT
jgi:glucose-6-phosphate dehydrogenase assembly protein OpcA